MLRAIAHSHAASDSAAPFDVVVLDHDGRHLRRKLIVLRHGDEVMVDLPEAIIFQQGDLLVLEDGRTVQIVAAEQELMAVVPSAAISIAQLCWHIGNRHLAAQIDEQRILVERDHVIRNMLLGLGAKVADVSEPFSPMRGAYSGQSHAHELAHEHAHGHTHD